MFAFTCGGKDDAHYVHTLSFSSSSWKDWKLHFGSSSSGSSVVSWPNGAKKLVVALKRAMLLAYLSMQVGCSRCQWDMDRYRSATWTWHLASLTLSVTTICKWEGFFRATKTSFLKHSILTSNLVVLKDIRGNRSWMSMVGRSLKGKKINLAAVTWMPHLTLNKGCLMTTGFAGMFWNECCSSVSNHFSFM